MSGYSPAGSASTSQPQADLQDGVPAGASIPTVATVFAGYFVLNADHGSVTAVRDAFRQPTATCRGGENATGSYLGEQNAWLGPALYDGNFATTHFTVFQTGVEALCQTFHHQPNYLPFYYRLELRPPDPPNPDNVMHVIPGIAVGPGDSIESAVEVSSGHVVVTFSDRTTHASATTTVGAPHLDANGALCLLNVFGNLARLSPVAQTCHATINGMTAGIGDFPAPNLTLRVVMANGTGAVQVSTSGLSADGTKFSLAWRTSEPLGPVFAPGVEPIFPGSHAAGYLLLNRDPAPVKSVSDTYRQSKVSCYAGESVENSTGHYPNDQLAYIGPGLYSGSGDVSSYRFFQVGTEATCQLFFADPVYVPYYLTETVTPSDPQGDIAMFAFPGMTVRPGDVLHATVSATAGVVSFSLADLTSGTAGIATLPVAGFHPNGAACVVEPIFNTANFTTVTQSCQATIGGLSAGIGDFATPHLLLKFDLHSTVNATVVAARTSGLKGDGATFSIQWVTSKPFAY